jgi:hypothetical protein
MNRLSRKRLIDKLVAAYVDWREACVRVNDARQQPRRPIAAKESVRTAKRRIHRPVPASHAGEDHRPPQGRHDARARSPGLPRHASRPFTWDDVVEKFDQLAADRIDNDLAKDIKDAVRSLEHIQVRDLMALLARIHRDQ